MKPLRVVQFSDTHQYSSSDGNLCGIKTRDSFTRVLKLLKTKEKSADLILMTGDLSQDESPQSYRFLRNAVSKLKKPVLALPGNHDHLPRMKKDLANRSIRIGGSSVHGDWCIVMLNSQILKSNSGRLAPSQLKLLKTSLKKNKSRHALVCLHHNPIPMKSRWMDTMKLQNDSEFWSIIDKAPNVRGVLWGHVHQQFDGKRKRVQLMSSPSTCLQFLPRSERFAIDTRPPGYRWLSLYTNGKIKSGVRRLAKFVFTPDLSSKGY